MDTLNVTQQRGKGWRYVEAARLEGVNVVDPYTVRTLLGCVEFVELVTTRKFKNQEQIAEAMGVSFGTLKGWIDSKLIEVATRIVLAEYFDDEARADMRNELYGTIRQYMPKALLNIARIAAGETFTSKNAKGQEIDVHPGFREQVQAFDTMVKSPIGASYLTELLTGVSPKEGIDVNQQLREALRSKARVILLDEEVIEGESREMSLAEIPAAPQGVSEPDALYGIQEEKPATDDDHDSS